MKLIVSSVIATLCASTAFAGSLTYTDPEPAPVPVLVETYNDVSWTGGYIGLQYGNGDAEASFSDDGENLSENVDIDGFGIHGGYLFDLGQFVVGGELSYDRLSADDDGGDADLTRLRGIAGYDFGKFMPFVTLGGAHISDDDVSDNGLTYGIGAQYMLTDKFVVGLEYSRTSFNDVFDQDGSDLDVDLIQIRGSYRF